MKRAAGITAAQKAAEMASQKNAAKVERERQEDQRNGLTSAVHGNVGVYIIGFRKWIKIGFSSKIPERLLHLQNNCPETLKIITTFHGDRWDEDRLHKLFAEYRVNGEWFRRPADLLEKVGAYRLSHSTPSVPTRESAAPPFMAMPVNAR
jgi:hypothetical protein